MQQSINNQSWAFAILSLYRRLGVKHICIAPGSRSAPLANAAFYARKYSPELKIHTFFDERGLGFFALNLSKGLNQPVIIITTSGTAVANLYPAVIEAYETHIPLLVLSADRPNKLLDCGANQAIQQENIFGRNVVHSISLELPSTDVELEKQFSMLAENFPAFPAVGPVQINCQFDEPLYGCRQEDYVEKSFVLNLVSQVKNRQAEGVGREYLAQLKASVASVNTLVVLGSLSKRQASVLAPWIESLNCPVIVDVASQFRFLKFDHVIHYADLLLLKSELRSLFSADCILQFGGRIVSRRINQFLHEHGGGYFIFQENKKCIDQTGKANAIVIPYEDVLDQLHALSPSHSALAELKRNNRKNSERLIALLSESWSEASICRAIVSNISDGDVLFIGNSLAIRMVDSFASEGKDISVFSNRGASGIDGIVASAVGASHSCCNQCVLILGDTSLLHDINSLFLVNKALVPIKIFVLNNNGGAIFNMLQASAEASYESLFQMPHNQNFEHIAHQFNLSYKSISNSSDLHKGLAEVMDSQENMLVELTIEACSGTEKVMSLLDELKASS